MPIFARTKLTIEEDCILPRPKIKLYYTGPNPDKSYSKILEIIHNTMRVEDKDVQEREFKWDRSSVPEKFSATIEVVKDFDKFTYMQLIINLSGSVKPSKEFGREGDVTVEIEGVTRTDYPQDTVWERSFLYEIFRTFYHKVFYQDERQKFKENCRDSMVSIQNELKEFFNLLPRVK